METTAKYKLKKPGSADFYNIEDFNANTDAIEAALVAHDESLSNKAPAELVSAYKYSTTAEVLEATVIATYNEMANRTKKIMSVNLGYSDYTAPGNGSWTLEFYRTDAEYGHIIASQYGKPGVRIMTRALSTGVWHPWEWLNPPMELGKEYRTTERYGGKPVYYKLWEFGNLPASTVKYVAHGLADVSNIWVDLSRSVVSAGDPNVNLLPFHTNITRLYPRYTLEGSPAILIETSSDLSTYTACLFLKYTKTTD